MSLRRNARGIERRLCMSGNTEFGGSIFTPASIPGLSIWLRADLGVTTVQGPVVATGTTPPTVTLSGTPSSTTNSIEIDITTPGVLGVAIFSWKLNGVTQQTLQVTSASFPLAGTGITASFFAGTYAADNVYTSVITVSAWADQSGLGHNCTQATASAQPALTPSDANYASTPSLLFKAASAQFMASPTFTITQPDTVYMVAKINTLGGVARELFDGVTSRQLIATSPGNVFEFFAGSGPVAGASGNTSPHLFCAVFNGASSSLYVDNTQSAFVSGNPGAGALTSLLVGAATGAVSPLDGSVSEMAIYSGTHTPSQRAMFASYVASRTGIAAS